MRRLLRAALLPARDAWLLAGHGGFGVLADVCRPRACVQPLDHRPASKDRSATGCAGWFGGSGGGEGQAAAAPPPNPPHRAAAPPARAGRASPPSPLLPPPSPTTPSPTPPT